MHGFNNRYKQGLTAVIIALMLFSCKDKEGEVASKTEKSTPNIIYILADDLGYGEIGAYGQEKIETPNIDALAKEGMMFTQHYTGAPVCAPARYMMLTGQHSGHAEIRGNHEWPERGDVWNYRAMIKDSTLEGQHPVAENTLIYPEILQKNGYATGMIGKWGLGAPHTNSIPNKMGFDYFYGYICQRVAHTYYPVHLYENESRVYLENDTIAPNTHLDKGADPNDPESYKKYTLKEYAPDLMFDQMIDFIDGNKEKPFFMYWASPIPHAPIQAPKRWVDYYREKFGPEEPYVGQMGYFPNQYPKASYAAMISYLDENVGKLVDYLKKEGLYENTLIVFTSDNGATFNGGTNSKYFNSDGPFGEGYGKSKGFVYEGGIRIPMIASWPGHIQAGSKTDLISAHYDVFATVTDLLGIKDSVATDGISFLPTLLGEPQEEVHDFLLWEFPEYGGQVAIRMGDWKVVRQHLKDDKQPTLELYNLSTDPEEENNVADQHPEILEKAAQIFEAEHENTDIERFRIPILENGLLETVPTE